MGCYNVFLKERPEILGKESFSKVELLVGFFVKQIVEGSKIVEDVIEHIVAYTLVTLGGLELPIRCVSLGLSICNSFYYLSLSHLLQ